MRISGPIKRITRAGVIADGLVGAREIHPVVRGMRVALNGFQVIGDGLVRIGIRKIPLLIPPQTIPCVGIVGFERSSALHDFQASGMNPVIGYPVFDGLEADKGTDGYGREEQRATLDRSLEREFHAR